MLLLFQTASILRKKKREDGISCSASFVLLLHAASLSYRWAAFQCKNECTLLTAANGSTCAWKKSQVPVSAQNARTSISLILWCSLKPNLRDAAALRGTSWARRGPTNQSSSRSSVGHQTSASISLSLQLHNLAPHASSTCKLAFEVINAGVNFKGGILVV